MHRFSTGKDSDYLMQLFGSYSLYGATNLGQVSVLCATRGIASLFYVIPSLLSKFMKCNWHDRVLLLESLLPSNDRRMMAAFLEFETSEALLLVLFGSCSRGRQTQQLPWSVEFLIFGFKSVELVEQEMLKVDT